MLVRSDYKGTGYSIFKCDRCGEILDMSKVNRYNITVDKYTNTNSINKKHVKLYHLCKRCTTLLVRGIERGNKK